MLNYNLKTITAMFSEDKVIEIFYLADEFCKFFDAQQEKSMLECPKDGKKHRRKPNRLSDAEIIVILIHFHSGGFRCFKHYYLHYICKATNWFISITISTHGSSSIWWKTRPKCIISMESLVPKKLSKSWSRNSIGCRNITMTQLGRSLWLNNN
mgnify:CR=1 FL=1